MNWQEGEFWFGNFNEMHSVHNQSDETRVHLVLDCTVNEALLALFPNSIMETMRPLIQIPKKHAYEASPEKLESMRGFFRFPRGIMKPHLPILGSIQANGNNIDIQVIGLPVKQQFYPISNTEFAFLGFTLLSNNESSFFISNEARKFELNIPIKKNLSILDRVQVGFQIVVGGGCYYSFKYSVIIIQTVKSIANKIKSLFTLR